MRHLLLGVAILLGSPAAAADLYVGGGPTIGQPLNTGNDYEHEASSEKVPGGCLFAGWQLASWAGLEGQGCMQKQFAHGHNPNGPDQRQSVEGTYYTVAVTAGPVLRLPADYSVLGIEPYIGGGLGIAYTIRDTTRGSVDGRNDDDRNVQGALRLAGGLEREIAAGWSARVEMSYMNVGLRFDAGPALEQVNVGASLLYSWRPR